MGTSISPRTPSPSPDPVRRWRTRDLAERTDTPRATTIRTLLPAMVTARVLVRRGRYWYGRATDIDAFLLGQWQAPSSSTRKGAR